MILRAHTVVTMDGPPIEDGAVRVRGQRIIEVGKFSDLAGTDEIEDLAEHILLPGLINAHCHLDYTCLRGKIPPPQSFANWIRAINAEKAKLSAEDYVASINQGFAEAKQFGTTTIANLTAFPELIAHVQDPIQTWWFAELIDVRQRVENTTALSSQASKRNEIVDRALANLKNTSRIGLAPHAPFTASANLYRCCTDLAERDKFLLATHLAESRQEMQMFRDAKGPLYEFLKEIGRDMTDCGRTTPLQAFLRTVRPRRDSSVRAPRGGGSEPADGPSESPDIKPPWIASHVTELTESDFALLAKMPRKISIVHCPRSHAYFGHTDFQFDRLRQLGFNISIGTDRLESNDDLSLFGEMRKVHDRCHVEPHKVLQMATICATLALKQCERLRKIRGNLLADMIALPWIRTSYGVARMRNFLSGVPWVILRG